MIGLNTDITQISRVGLATARKLKKLGVETVQDLLFYFPYRYDNFSQITPIGELKAGMSANVVGQVELIQSKRSPRKRMYITEALVSDGEESLRVIWFNQPFVAKTIRVGDTVSLSGKIDEDYGGEIMKSPVYEKVSGYQAIHTQGLIPNYHLTTDITQKQIRFLTKQIIVLAGMITDWLPEDTRKSAGLIRLGEAIGKTHFPKNQEDILVAKKRLAFDELFLIQLRSQMAKISLKDARAEQIIFHEKETKKFVEELPFKLTNAQRKTSWEILQDIEKDKPMTRLLEGDVGSGKTVVAAIAMLNVALNKKQSVLMVPTEILAQQHFSSIGKLLSGWGIKIALITRSSKEISNYVLEKKNKQERVSEIIRNADIIIGTHALIQEEMMFDKLGLVVIDEQHRFGVEQRSALLRINTENNRSTQKVSGNNNLLYEDITYKIRGVIFKVKKELGLGHKESIYQKALEKELKNSGLFFEKEKNIEIKYNGEKVGAYRPDFVIEEKIVLEIKALPFVGKIEKSQVWHYLKGSSYKLALLVNFGRDDVKIERIINSYDRSALSQRGSALMPHLLSMTATPIPRSLAMALYGDLDISVINEMPKDRKKIITQVVDEKGRERAYQFIRDEVKDGRQVFVICPLIDFSDKLGVKSVKQEFEKLDKNIFPEIKIGMMHGRMKSAEKEKIMNDFLANKIKILVSTSIIEVGIDIPNAGIMMIEGADRFGLAQLHQFRGRVGRAEHQSYCFLFTDSDSSRVLNRLTALVNHHDGFSLAKIDLKFRGPGEVYGTLQKGFPELKMASLFDYELMKTAKEEAEKILRDDPGLNKHFVLKEKAGETEEAHLE